MTPIDTHGQTTEERDYYALSRRVYAIFAHVYDAVVLPVQRLRHEVASMVELPPGSRLLDVATGTGAQAFAFAGKAREVVGIDLSAAMLRVAERKNHFSNVRFQQADAVALPFEDECFDASCISFALHEMPASIRKRVLGEMARVTKTHGQVVVVDYGLPRGRVTRWLAYHSIKLYEGDHYVSFLATDLAGILGSTGIEVSEQRPALAGLAAITIGRKTEAHAQTGYGHTHPRSI